MSVSRVSSEWLSVVHVTSGGLTSHVNIYYAHLQQASTLDNSNLFIYQAREASLVPAGFLTGQILQRL